MLWTLRTFLEFVQYRGIPATAPISVIVDEIAYILNMSTSRERLLVQDMEELIRQIARSHMLWLTLGHQAMDQIPEELKPTLMSMGIQLLGYTTSPKSAMEYAERYAKFDPTRAKAYRPIHQTSFGVTTVIGDEPIYMTYEEQRRQASYRFMELKTFEFLLAATEAEGQAANSVRKISTAGLDVDPWTGKRRHVNKPKVEKVRRGLAKRSGVPLEERAILPDDPAIRATYETDQRKAPNPYLRQAVPLPE